MLESDAFRGLQAGFTVVGAALLLLAAVLAVLGAAFMVGWNVLMLDTVRDAGFDASVISYWSGVKGALGLWLILGGWASIRVNQGND